jgi:hypothetical protein
MVRDAALASVQLISRRRDDREPSLSSLHPHRPYCQAGDRAGQPTRPGGPAPLARPGRVSPVPVHDLHRDKRHTGKEKEMTPSDSFVASQLTPAAASPERQEDEPPPEEHSLDESWRRRVVRKAADAATNIADAAIEMLTSLLP